MSETGLPPTTSAATRDLVARDLASVWHPFTQHAMWAYDEPLVIERGEGMHLVDSDGVRYLDGVSSLWVTVHGHGVPEIDEAIRRQLGRLDHSTFLGLTHEPGIELAEKLLATAPPPSSAGCRACSTPATARARSRPRSRWRSRPRRSAARTARSTCTSPRATTATPSAR